MKCAETTNTRDKYSVTYQPRNEYLRIIRCARCDASWIRSCERCRIAPERLLRALLLQVFSSIRSERLLMEQLDYNLLFRWFVGLGMDDAVWNHAVFSKNRERLLIRMWRAASSRVCSNKRSHFSRTSTSPWMAP